MEFFKEIVHNNLKSWGVKIIKGSFIHIDFDKIIQLL